MCWVLLCPLYLHPPYQSDKEVTAQAEKQPSQATSAPHQQIQGKVVKPLYSYAHLISGYRPPWDEGGEALFSWGNLQGEVETESSLSAALKSLGKSPSVLNWHMGNTLQHPPRRIILNSWRKPHLIPTLQKPKKSRRGNGRKSESGFKSTQPKKDLENRNTSLQPGLPWDF